jgi:antirestriction protein
MTNHTRQYCPQIYVVNSAPHHPAACWVDAAQHIEDILAQIHRIIPSNQDWNIQDFDHFGNLAMHHRNLQEICTIAQLLVEYGDVTEAAIEYDDTEDISILPAVIDEKYQGQWDSELSFAIHLFDECYGHAVPSTIQYYIDYEQFKHDIFIGDYTSIRLYGTCHIFCNH